MENKEIFDIIIENQFGIKCGQRKLVFIKTGKGGTIAGYENKYLKLTQMIYERYGFSIAISANPVESTCVLQAEIEVVSRHTDFDSILFIGISNGALVGAQQGYLIPQISDMLLINAPLMINWPRTKRGIQNFNGNSVKMIYGTKDPSYKFLGLLDCISNQMFKYVSYEGADHHFKGMDEVFYDEILVAVEEAAF